MLVHIIYAMLVASYFHVVHVFHGVQEGGEGGGRSHVQVFHLLCCNFSPFLILLPPLLDQSIIVTITITESFYTITITIITLYTDMETCHHHITHHRCHTCHIHRPLIPLLPPIDALAAHSYFPHHHHHHHCQYCQTFAVATTVTFFSIVKTQMHFRA